MDLAININLDNEAFNDDGQHEEIKRCLSAIARKIENGQTDGVVIDSNGNKVGNFTIEGR
jgi:hypothetical protein